MRATELIRRDNSWHTDDGEVDAQAQLIICFGPTEDLEAPDVFESLRSMFAKADIVLCSAGGEIQDDSVHSGTPAAVALSFASTSVRSVVMPMKDASKSLDVATSLASRLAGEALRHVLVFAEGLGVNGTDLAIGLVKALPQTVSVTGGLAGDGERFARTVVGLNEAAKPGQVVAIGLYGSSLEVGMGSLGGWDATASEMVVTRSAGNVVYELDGEPALDVYKRLLGVRAYGLPATGLLYPLEVQSESGRAGVTRTLLGVDTEANTLTFAGDVREGRRVKMMQANLDRLIDAAGAAAEGAATNTTMRAQFVLLISCIGRKLVLQQRAREEVSSVRNVVGPDATIAGFYSYGELSPLAGSGRCELLNQTMTVTTFAER